MPLVSVLMPARDAAQTVEGAVRSILAQTLDALELIAVDDGSVDGTRAVLRRLAASDARLRLVEGGGGGLVHALEVGLRHCRGPLIARMDADDESLPRRIELSVAALEADSTLAGVGTGVEIFRQDRPVSPNMAAYGRWLNSLTTPERLFADRFVESPLCHPAVTLRRSALSPRASCTMADRSSWAFAGRLNLLSLGDEDAASLGVHVARTRALLLAGTSLAVAVAVALAGLVGFVGLIVPHVLRLWLGPDQRLLLPASALGGAAFLALADLLARLLFTPFGAEPPVGAVTALLGGPFFLLLLHRGERSAAP